MDRAFRGIISEDGLIHWVSGMGLVLVRRDGRNDRSMPFELISEYAGCDGAESRQP